MRVAIVPSTDLDSKDLRASRYVPKAPQRDSHTFTVIVGEDDETRWEWCIRCGALRLYGEHMYPGPRQAMTIKGTTKTRRCAADKAPGAASTK